MCFFCVVKILLISDTHAWLDPALDKHMTWADEVWHAGDVGNIELIDRIADFAPCRVVHGNIDGQEVRREAPKHLDFEVAGLRVYMTHIGGYPKKYPEWLYRKLQMDKPDLFICGHSHILKVIYDKQLGILHMNPGAVGRSGFHKVRTAIRFQIKNGKVADAEVIEFGGK